MSTNGNKKKRLQDLREAAESTVGLPPAEFRRVPAEQAQKLIRDLTLQIIDLQMENERLSTAQSQLEESRKACASLFDFAPFPYVSINSHGAIINANFVASDLLGIPRSQLASTDFPTLMEPQYQDILRRSLREIETTGAVQRCELELRRRDHSTFFAELQIVGVYEREGLVYRLAINDLTERKRTEEQLRLFGLMVESVADAVFSTDERLRLTTWNRAAVRQYGWTPEEVMGRELEDVLQITYPNNDRDAAIKDLYQHGQWTGEVTHRTRDGNLLNVIAARAILRDERDRIIGIAVIAHDITARKKAEEALRESEVRLRSTMDNMLEGAQIIDRAWRYAYLNDAAAKHGRRDKRDLVGHTMMEMYPGIENTSVFQSLKVCMEQRVPQHAQTEFVFPDGSRGLFELRIEPVPDGILVLSLENPMPREARAQAPEVAI